MGNAEPAVSNRRHIFVRALLIAALTMASLCVGTAQRAAETPLFDRWANAREPLPGPPAAIGFYSAGCLQGAEALPLDGTGYVEYSTVLTDQRKQLSTTVNALSEELSKLSLQVSG